MSGIFKYIFKPLKRDANEKKIVESLYHSALNTEAVACMIMMVMELFFLMFTIIKPSLYGDYLWLYRGSYIAMMTILVIGGLTILYVKKDFEDRNRFLPILNIFWAAVLYVFALVITRIDAMHLRVVDPTLFMTITVCIPLCIYLEPIIYIIMDIMAHFSMIYLFVFIAGNENLAVVGSVMNYVVFSVIQIIMGIAFFYTRFYLNERILDSECQKEEIKKLGEAQNRFFSSMSHEIRTPINTIIGLNEMILREDISDEVAEDAANIQSAGKMLLHTINDILDMSKIQAGQMQITSAAYKTGNMLSEIVGMLWIKAKEKGLAFRINVAPDLPSELYGDEVRIKQILINVLNNAIKYTNEGSVTLSIQCEKLGEGRTKMIYSVADTGIGIKKESMPYLFSAFKRVDEDKNRYIEGTGLGLSIVRELVDLMDGKIMVNSIYTKGTTFVIEIPQDVLDENTLGEVDFEHKGSTRKREVYSRSFEAPDAKVLVVDDTPANLLVVSKLLRETKVNLHTASSGAEALAKTLENQYHVIFMDHMMPGMDGIECLHRIRNQAGGLCRESKIVILTANAQSENRAVYQNEGFDGYLVKPIGGAELETELARLLPKELVHLFGDNDKLIEESMEWITEHKKKVAVLITTESVADLPEDIIEKYGIPVLAHKVLTGKGIFNDGTEVETKGLLSYMNDEAKSAQTAAPDVKEHESFFAKQLEKANHVIHISITNRVDKSGCPAAKEAAAAFDNVTVIDSRHLSSGQGLLVIEACRMAEKGCAPGEIVARIEQLRDKVYTSFIVDNLDYLARANQVKNWIASLSKAFLVRPVLSLRGGRMVLSNIYIGTHEQAWKSYVKNIMKHAGAMDKRILFITYAGLKRSELELIVSWIEKYARFDRIVFQQASPAISVNCGPGTFGILYMTRT